MRRGSLASKPPTSRSAGRTVTLGANGAARGDARVSRIARRRAASSPATGDIGQWQRMKGPAVAQLGLLPVGRGTTELLREAGPCRIGPAKRAK